MPLSLSLALFKKGNRQILVNMAALVEATALIVQVSLSLFLFLVVVFREFVKWSYLAVCTPRSDDNRSNYVSSVEGIF